MNKHIITFTKIKIILILIFSPTGCSYKTSVEAKEHVQCILKSSLVHSISDLKRFYRLHNIQLSESQGKLFAQISPRHRTLAMKIKQKNS